jgi:hypothetical protein
MTNRIVAMAVPTYFVDEQIRGPFARFHHEHRFISVGEATQMIDTIEYSSPFGVLGRSADRIGLKRYLTNLIRIRNNTSRPLPRRHRFCVLRRWVAVRTIDAIAERRAVDVAIRPNSVPRKVDEPEMRSHLRISNGLRTS